MLNDDVRQIEDELGYGPGRAAFERIKPRINSERIGAMVVDEVIAPIVGVRIENHSFKLTARIYGPVSERETGWHDCRIHGSDGSLVLAGQIWCGWLEAREGDVVEFSFVAEPRDHAFGGESD